MTEEFEIPPDIYNTLNTVSELSKKLKPCCLVKAEKSAAIKLGIELQSLTSDCSDHISKSVVKMFEKLFIINRSLLTCTQIRNSKQGAAIANKDYSSQQPIFLFGILSQKLNIPTVSSTYSNQVLLGPLRGANTSNTCNSKYLEVKNIQNLFICVATKRIYKDSQILINYEPGKTLHFWVRSY